MSRRLSSKPPYLPHLGTPHILSQLMFCQDLPPQVSHVSPPPTFPRIFFAGTASLTGYGGGFRGVYFTPDLNDGEFRQFAVLPITLFDETLPTQPAKSPPKSDLKSDPQSAPPPNGKQSPPLDSSPVGKAKAASTPPAVTPVVAAYAAATSNSDDAATASTASAAETPRAPSSPSPPPSPPPSPSPRFVRRAPLDAVADDSPPLTKLHTHGYVRLPSSHQLEASLVDEILASPWEPIFNGHSLEESPLRFQVEEQPPYLLLAPSYPP